VSTRNGGGGGAGANEGEAEGATGEVVHRGVRWRRSASGRTLWFNEGLRRWVLWAPGSDAPPLPPSFEVPEPTDADAADGPPPTDAMSTRAPMRSPYRIVPVVIAVFVVAIALWQATRTPGAATKADIAAAVALKGECLTRDGGNASYPVITSTSVKCSEASAFAKVIAVIVPGHPGSCPSGSDEVQVLRSGAKGEPHECIVPVRHYRAG
jgi:hypothetical protein